MYKYGMSDSRPQTQTFGWGGEGPCLALSVCLSDSDIPLPYDIETRNKCPSLPGCVGQKYGIIPCCTYISEALYR